MRKHFVNMLKYLGKVLSQYNCDPRIIGYNYSYSNYLKIVLDFMCFEPQHFAHLKYLCTDFFYFKEIIFARKIIIA